MKYKIAIVLMTLIICGISTIQQSYAEDRIDALAELKAASDYFKNINIGELRCDIKVLFDGSDQYDKDDIDKWNVAKGTYIFLGEYYYHDGGIFHLKVFGEEVAKNDAESLNSSSANIVVPMLPLPGGIMASEDILKRYSVEFNGEEEFDGYKCNRIRLQAKDSENEFFNYIEYSIDVKHKVVRKVECAYALGVWAGSGYGEFYYKSKRGKLLPSVGYGSIYFRSPYQRRLTLWGKWAGFDMKSIDDISDVEKSEPVTESK